MSEMNSGNDSNTLLFAKQSSIVFFGNFVFQITGFVFLLVATRLVSPSAYGVYTLALAVIVFLQVLSDLNLYRALDFFLPQELRDGELGTARRVLLDVSALAFASSLAFSILVFFGSDVIAETFDESTLGTVLPLLAISLVLRAFINIYRAVFRSVKKLKYEVLVEYLVLPIVQLMVAVALLTLGLEIYGLVGGYMAGLIAAFIVGTVIIRNQSWIRKGPLDHFRRRRLLSYSLPLVFAGVFYKTIGQIDYFVIGWLGTASDVGIYRVGYQLTNNMLIVLSSMIPIFKPMISENISDTDELQRQFRLATRWATMFTLPVALTILIAPTQYVTTLFTAKYASASLSVAILAVGFLAHGSVGISATFLEGTDKTRFNLLNGIFFLTINTILDILLVPMFGIVGAAIGTSCARLLSISAEMIEIRYFYDITVSVSDLMLLFAGAIPVIVVGKTLAWVIDEPLLLVAALPIVSIVAYFSTLLFVGAFTDDDRKVAALVDEKLGRPVLEPLVS